MQIVSTIEELSQTDAQGAGGGEVLVPTMGAMHPGHADLIRLARERAGASGKVVVSIFVNPSQFNESTDFEHYPRDLDADCDFCQRLGVDIVFAPPPDVVYPPDEEVPVGELPAVATEPGLEDAYRPGHFAGVCRVVRRLFLLIKPEAAVFGEKDWQQLRVVGAMTDAEGLGVEIVPCPTAREPDGLAMSSRNRLLNTEARAAAAAIPQALEAANACPTAVAAQVAMLGVLARAGIEAEYAAIRDAETLDEVQPDAPCRALIAARVGGVRLIDNGPWAAALLAGD